MDTPQLAAVTSDPMNTDYFLPLFGSMIALTFFLGPNPPEPEIAKDKCV